MKAPAKGRWLKNLEGRCKGRVKGRAETWGLNLRKAELMEDAEKKIEEAFAQIRKEKDIR